MELNLNFRENRFVNDLGEALVCYESTDKFAFLCPYKEREDGSLSLDIRKTYVYSLKIGDLLDGEFPIESIEK